ncbi:MAG TPA: SURF1 family protein [Steroidobacteraceae bacterium]|nr:SURF1 family protein [Steroidobacteraceae bacterium]
MRLRIGAHALEAQLLPTALMLVLLAALLALGFWQLARMREKQALFAMFAAGTSATVDLVSLRPGSSARYQHAAVTGRYDSEHQILLDNMTRQGQVGYRVLTPLRFEAGRTVLVDRGWIPLGESRQKIPDVTVAEAQRRVSGRLDELPRAGIHLAAEAKPDAPWPQVLSYPSMKEVLVAMPQDLYPYILLLDADQSDGFVREWQPATFPPQRHLGYAVTWFAMAAALVIIYVATHWRRGVPQ